MKIISAKMLKNKTGDVIREIRRGKEVLVSYRGKPLAKFVPVQETSILESLSGVLKGVSTDRKTLREERLKEKHEGLY